MHKSRVVLVCMALVLILALLIPLVGCKRRWDHCYTHAYRHEHGRHDNANQNADCNENTNRDEDPNGNEDSNVYVIIRQYIE